MKPIKVKNPTSMQHIVRIKSGQYVQLHLDENIFPNHEIRISPSDNIFIGEQEQSENYSTYLIHQFIWVKFGLILKKNHQDYLY